MTLGLGGTLLAAGLGRPEVRHAGATGRHEPHHRGQAPAVRAKKRFVPPARNGELEPFVTTEQSRRGLGISEQAISYAVERGDVSVLRRFDA